MGRQAAGVTDLAAKLGERADSVLILAQQLLNEETGRRAARDDAVAPGHAPRGAADHGGVRQPGRRDPPPRSLGPSPRYRG